MGKARFSNPAFQTEGSAEVTGFNMVSHVNSFTSVFDTKPLEHEEEVRLQKLLFDNHDLSGAPKEEAERKITSDFNEIKSITAEIKSIQNQGIILIGERIEKAQELLIGYRDGTFTKWLKDTFKSKQTGYNILSYYQLYKSLPSPKLQECFRKIPQRVAYVLANREGNQDKKIEIIRDHYASKPNHIIELVHEFFPLKSKDGRKRKMHDAVIVERACSILKLLVKRKRNLSDETKEQIEEIRKLIDQILA